MFDLKENIVNEMDAEIVLGKDERAAIKDTRKKPFRWICSLAVTFPEPVIYPLGTLEHPGKNWKDLTPSRTGCGTGLLISPNHVLTSAHVVAGLKVITDSSTGIKKFKIVKASSVKIIPGRNDKSRIKKPFGEFVSKTIMASPEFINALEKPILKLTKSQVRKALSSDFGIIELKEKKGKIKYPGQSAGWWREEPNFKIKTATPNFRQLLKSEKANIGGYPGDKGFSPCSTPWFSRDKIVSANTYLKNKKENLLLYQADTTAGMSGSPVWIENKNGQFILVAVHSSFLDFFDKKRNKKKMVNVGCLITQEVVKQLRTWKVGYLEIVFSKKTNLKKG